MGSTQWNVTAWCTSEGIEGGIAEGPVTDLVICWATSGEGSAWNLLPVGEEETPTGTHHCPGQSPFFPSAVIPFSLACCITICAALRGEVHHLSPGGWKGASLPRTPPTCERMGGSTPT
eukprot:gene16436-biopygen2061